MSDLIELVAVESLHDFEVAAAILRESAEWMIKNNIPNWRLDEFDPVEMQRDQSDHYYLAMRSGAAIGTLKVQHQDEMFWPEAVDNDSIFVHKLAVRRGSKGQNIGYEMLDRVREIGREQALTWLRLDCRGDRPKLRRYYEQYGLQLVDECWVKDQFFTARYQMRLEDEDHHEQS